MLQSDGFPAIPFIVVDLFVLQNQHHAGTLPLGRMTVASARLHETPQEFFNSRLTSCRTSVAFSASVLPPVVQRVFPLSEPELQPSALPVWTVRLQAFSARPLCVSLSFLSRAFPPRPP